MPPEEEKEGEIHLLYGLGLNLGEGGIAGGVAGEAYAVHISC
jgi:hypothetical protein